MTPELKEKMQQAAKKYCAQICNTCGSRKNCNRVDLGRCLPTEDEYTAFLDGAEAMYAELAPIVEWVSIEERLPVKEVQTLFKDKYGHCTVLIMWTEFGIRNKFTHWCKIKL